MTRNTAASAELRLLFLAARSPLRSSTRSSVPHVGMLTLLSLPDELLICCTDGSLRTTVRLASTSSGIRARLILRSSHCGYRLVCRHPYIAMDIEREMRDHFHIEELVLPCSWWPFYYWDVIKDLYTNCKLLRIIHVDPQHANEVKWLYTKSFMAKDLVKMKEARGFTIAARPVIKKSKPLVQLTLTDMPSWPWGAD